MEVGAKLTDGADTKPDGVIAGKARGFDQMIMLGSGLSPEGQLKLCARLVAGAMQRVIVAATASGKPLSRRERKAYVEMVTSEIKRGLNANFLRGNDKEPLP